MNQWEPLADRIPLDMRRLATQLRRMKDRSGLTVPALAARTALPADVWEHAFAGRRLPPLHGVEVLAQACGADYERVDALWKLADKACAGVGDRVRGRPLPVPDPLDPLGPEEGLPRRRGAVLLASAALLAAAALVAMVLTAVPSTGRAPSHAAGPVPSGASGTVTHPPTGASSARAADPSATGPAARRSGPPAALPGAASPAAAAGDETTATSPPASATTAPGTGGSTPPSTPAGPPSSPTHSAAPTATPTPSPTKDLCLGLILLGVCVG